MGWVSYEKNDNHLSRPSMSHKTSLCTTVESFCSIFDNREMSSGCVSLVITDSEAYDIVANDSPRSPGCGVGTVIEHGSSGLSRAGFWRRRVLQSGFEIPWTSIDQPIPLLQPHPNNTQPQPYPSPQYHPHPIPPYRPIYVCPIPISDYHPYFLFW